jgi:predicted  nucleic acid-binding Zn-ribbon protein
MTTPTHEGERLRKEVTEAQDRAYNYEQGYHIHSARADDLHQQKLHLQDQLASLSKINAKERLAVGANLSAAQKKIEQQEHEVVNAQAEVERLKARVEELESAIYEFVKWYDTDGSIGACSTMLNGLRYVFLKPVRQDQEDQQ